MRESVVRDHFARQYRGRIEVSVRFGRCDVVTDVAAVEVEPYETWRRGARQAMAYAHELDRYPALAVYGDMTLLDVRRMAARCRGVIALHVLDGSLWHHIRSGKDAIACRMATPTEVGAWPTAPVQPHCSGHDRLGRFWVIEGDAA